jgi:predicted O-methyltransferase YrrM
MNTPFFYGRMNPYLRRSIEFSSKNILPIYTKSTTLNEHPQSNELNGDSHSNNANEKSSSAHYLNILRKIHSHLNPYNYLEIGVRHGDSLRLARNNAIGIDPQPDIKFDLHENHKLYKMTSDEFFKNLNNQTNYKVDFAFIDGMHLFEFALRDFINIEKISSKNTLVAIDDIFPNNELEAHRNRQTQVWTGDIWKIYYCLKKFRPDLLLFLIDSYPTGMLLVFGLDNNNQTLSNKYDQITESFIKINRVPKDILKRNLSFVSNSNEIDNILEKIQSSNNLRQS